MNYFTLFKLSIIILLINTMRLPLQAQESNYWQQKVNYHINVKLIDSSNTLQAHIKIIYYNNSPNTLNFIYMHLWPNAYSGDGTALSNDLLKRGNADLYYATEDKLGNITNLDFRCNKQKLNWSFDPKNHDIAKIILPQGLKSGDSIEISTPFRVKIPSAEFSRLGHSGQSYQITQWYPKPAVYDAKGWHTMPYLNQGEFYSEYGNYDVYISLPQNYRIWATGDLIDGEKENHWLDSIAAATAKIKKFPEDLSFPPSSIKSKTLHFHQEKVHDFAWFADKRYYVLRGKLSLANGHSVRTQSMFTNEDAFLWTKSIDYIDSATSYYSQRVGNYPYHWVTAVQGTLSAGAGMEYPNITIIGQAESSTDLEEVILHEVGHNWFYGLLGFNERDYPWMDEGINTFYQTEYMNHYYPHLNLSQKYFHKNISILGLDKLTDLDEMYYTNRFMASYNLDQACNLTSSKYTTANYGIIIYEKVPLLFKYLQSYLGKENFDTIMHGFYQKWKYKHPQPEDIKSYFEAKSKKNLSWFFDGLLVSKERTNYKICKAKEKEGCISLKIKNKGNNNSPVFIKTRNSIGKINSTQWIDGFSGTKTITLKAKDYSRIGINEAPYMLDYDQGNNYYYPKKIFKKRKILKFKFISSIPKEEQSIVYYTPVMGWNLYNKFMFGVLLYNHSIFEKKWEYELMPLYSTRTKDWNGSAAIRHNFYTSGGIRRISLGISAKRYHYDIGHFENSFQRIVPGIKLYFKNPDGNTSIKNQMQFRVVIIDKQFDHYEYQPSLSNYTIKQATQYYTVYNFNYTHENKRIITPYKFRYNLEFNKEIVKMDFRTEVSVNYFAPKKYLEIGFFGGYMLKYPKNPQVDYSYKMSSWSGSEDYLYDYIFLGRSARNGLLGNQMVQRDGGFYIPSALGRSWGFLGSINLRSSLPFTNFIKIYFNAGVSVNPTSLQVQDSKSPLYEGGVILSIINKDLEIYFPVLLDAKTKNYLALNNISYANTIRFTMRLNLLNPFKALKELHL